MTEQTEERVNHPSWYTQHPSGIECIDLIEHLSLNIGNAIKYLWRCGLKKSETPLRDLKSALWYVKRERRRVELYELDMEDSLKTEVVWRAAALQVIEMDNYGVLGRCLQCLLEDGYAAIIDTIEEAITALEEPTNAG